MATLYFSLDGNALGEFVLNKSRMTIGRRPANDIHIDHLSVSGEHAVITTIANDSFLEDLNSTNGTIVNLKPIKKHVLQHADVIQFGKYQLRFENLAQEKLSNQHGFENTAVMQSPKPTIPAKPKQEAQLEAESVPTVQTSNNQSIPQAASQAATALVNQAPIMARLQVLTGASVGSELQLNKALTTLGEPGVQVAVITKRPHGYFLSHVQGDRLPFVNGQPLGSQAYQLVDNDVIDIKGTKLQFNVT
jgi:pSer/pThr/pTyr-binding forkhead associated (FHA) protein